MYYVQRMKKVALVANLMQLLGAVYVLRALKSILFTKKNY